MKICNENPLSEIKKIIQQKAKYQKVMLLYDNTVSTVEIGEIYNAIKELCVYNQSNILEVEKNEIYNGYRLIIFFCDADCYLKCDIDNSEFVNIFFPTNSSMLPYFLSKNNQIINAENYLIIDKQKYDFSMLSSMSFNIFFHDFKRLINGNHKGWNFDLVNQISCGDIFEVIKKIEQDTVFLDIAILKKCDIEYKHLVFVDLILIDAIITMLCGIKSKNLMMVDVYKAGKDDIKLIDKFYKLYNNETFINFILLNFNCVYNYCLKVKQKIKDLIVFYEITQEDIEKIIDKIKLFAKESEDVISYLYLFNIFNV